jgi:hypothetical protein
MLLLVLVHMRHKCKASSSIAPCPCLFQVTVYSATGHHGISHQHRSAAESDVLKLMCNKVFQPKAQVKSIMEAAGLQLDSSSNAALVASLAAVVAAAPETARLVRALATRAMSEAQYFSMGEVRCPAACLSPAVFWEHIGMLSWLHPGKPERISRGLISLSA